MPLPTKKSGTYLLYGQTDSPERTFRCLASGKGRYIIMVSDVNIHPDYKVRKSLMMRIVGIQIMMDDFKDDDDDL